MEEIVEALGCGEADLGADEVLVLVVDAHKQAERAAEQEEVVDLKAKLKGFVCLVSLIGLLNH